MGNKVAKHKVEGVRRDLLKGKSYKQAMLNNGYSENRSNEGIRSKAIQEALAQNSTDLKARGLDAEAVIAEIRWGITESKTMKAKKDRLQAHSNYVNIAARHVLKQTLDIEGIKPTNITNIVRTNQEAKDRVSATTHDTPNLAVNAP